MDGGDSPPSVVQNQVDSVCWEKYDFSSSFIWTSKVGKIMKQFYCFFFMNREGPV